MIQALVVDLLPWLVVFFLADGVVQLGRGHLLLAGARRLRPLRAGLDWLGPSPLVEAVALFDLPYLRGGGRVWFLDPRRRTEPPVVEAADLTAVDLAASGVVTREGKAVTAGGKRVLSAPAAAIAQRLLDDLAPREPTAPAAPRRLRRAARTDLRAARAMRLRQRRYRPLLQATALALALHVLELALGAWGPLAGRIPLGPAGAGFGLLLVAAAALGTAFLRASGERWGTSLHGGLGMLLPWAALHPLVHLSRTVYRRFDALTAAAALLPPSSFHALAGRELVRARLSRARTAPELGPAWEERERLLIRLLEATGSSEEEALAPPPAQEGTAAYCPLCRTRYRAGFEGCADCGLPLEPLGGAPISAARTPRTAP